MRYIVITLILANVIYFGWRFLASEPATVAPTAKHIDKSQIELLPEDDSADVEPATEPSAPVPAMKTETAATVTAESESSDTQETQANDEPATTVVSDEAPVSIEQPSVKLICVQTPWTRDEKIVAAWRAATGDYAVETLTQEVETQRRFLVYIPAKDTPEKTLDRLRELKSMPLESAHINKGEYIGGISLGLFSQQESARAVLKKVHDLGITDAKEAVRVLTATEYRLRRQTADAVNEPWTACL